VTRSGAPIRDEGEEARRIQLVEVTIDSLAEVGYVGTTLAEIGRRAGVSAGLVAHYFGDKDGLLEAAFRTLARSLAVRVRARLALAHTPRGRVQAVIDTNLAPEEFDKRSGTAWLAFWGQVLHVSGLKRVQTAYQRRMLSNLRSDLRHMIPGEEARSLAAMIAAMIDGVWLRAALSEWQEADSESARALLTAFVEGRLKDLTAASAPDTARVSRTRASAAASLRVINPATGALLAEIPSDGAAQVDAAVARAQLAQRQWAALTGAQRGRILARAAGMLRERNDELAHLETLNTGNQ
jgi:betaine-aldehyde dehydrogenase